MKVKQLIKRLQRLDGNATIYHADYGAQDGKWEVEGVAKEDGEWLICGWPCDDEGKIKSSKVKWPAC
jgi:hypothetical protein